VVIDKKKDRYPWLKVGENENLKLFAVNRKFESNSKPRETYMRT